MTYRTLDEYLKQTNRTTTKQPATKLKYKITGFYKEIEFQETPIGKIPKDWKITELSKIIKLSSGKPRPRIISKIKTKTTPYPIYGGNGVLGYTNKYLVENDVIVIGRVGEHCGVVHKAPKFSWITDNALYTKEIRQDLNIDYLKYLLVFLNLNRYKKKSGQPLITQSIIYRIKVSLPPIGEQWGIAEVLSTMDRVIETTERLIKRLERLKRGLIQELLTKGLGHKKFKDTPIGKIPKEWKIVKLEDIAEIVNGFTFPLNLQGKNAGKFPFIKVGDMNKTYKYITSADNYIDEYDLRKLKARPFPKGTIIFPKIGMAMRLNKFRILGRDALFDNNVAGVIPKKVNNEFLYYYFVGKINLISLAGTTTVPSITKTRLKKLLVPLPPFEEQKRIATILSITDDWIELERKRKEKLERLKRGLMDLLLTGRVRVRVERVS